MKKLALVLLTLTLMVSCRKKNLVIINNSDKGLVAHYPLDGNGRDYTSNRNHGTITAVLGSDRYGLPSKAYSFESHFFQSSKIPINLSKEYTFSFWVKMNRYNDGMAIMELAKPMGDDTTYVPCNLNPQIWQYRDSMFLTTASNINNQIYIMSLKNIKSYGTPTWSHVAWTVNNNVTTMYVNGDSITTRLMPWPDVSLVSLTLGNAGNTCPGDMGVTNYHNQPSVCSIDEVRVYNRALSITEIRQLSK